MIGPSIAVRGDLAGEQDLLIEGHFEGAIEIPGYQVTIGPTGRVKAEIRAKVITIEGELKGNLRAEQQAVVRSTGKVQGDIKAPRVALDEGCQFKGAIDMEPAREPSAGKTKPEHKTQEPKAEPEADKAQAKLPTEQKSDQAAGDKGSGTVPQRP